VNNQIWKPGRDVAVDETICRFTGRAYEITTVPNKPTPTGIKIWNIGQRGFLSNWSWHAPGKKNGPIGVKVPVELGGSKAGKGGNKTQAVVLHLLDQLPRARYHVYLDNLFTSTKLLEVLRTHGYGATGTCRTNAGVISELVEIKKRDQKKDELPWGTLYSMPTPSGLVNQLGWKDMAFALVMSTVYDGKKKVWSLRRRPKETSTSAKTARKPFGNQTTKRLEIPDAYNQYNHNMLAIDVADQMAASNSGRRRIRRGAWQALDQWLLVTVLVNTYLVSYYSDVEGKRSINFRSQRDFRIQIIEGLMAMGRDVPDIRKPHNLYTKPKLSGIPNISHHQVKRQARKDCAACKGQTFWDKPQRRTPLARKTANQKTDITRRSTIYGCKECDVALCGKGGCFKRYHRSRDN
jgi:hypothetical protein